MEPSGADPGGQGLGSQSTATVPWSHISFGPAAAWVEEPGFDRSLPAKEGTHITHLIWSRQIDVEAETSFHCTAVRLETPLAVQHQSQWRLNLDPRIQRLVLHRLCVVRDGQRSDNLQRERMRLIQRETQLDHLVIDGQWTLLVVLDDVRPGDVIEAAYSFLGPDPIRPGGCEAFFFVPPSAVLGRYQLRVDFDGAHSGMRWLASADAPQRVEEQLAGNRTRWTWNGSQTTPREPEHNQPGGFLDCIWVQISDLPDWKPLASRLSEAWQRTHDNADLAHFSGFARPAVVDETAVLGLVQQIQDEFRYLSVDLESGGWIPMSPTVVARRRYGDCKDLAWLATCVLRSWGATARTILVSSRLRSRVETLLPMAILFDHALLEVEVGGNSRWFDLTHRAQGGGFAQRVVPWYFYGLPVDAAADALVSQPGRRANILYAIRETILLDTRKGKPSLVEQRTRVEGWQADNLRRIRLAQGADEFAKDRLKQLQHRYSKATRVGALHWRDDRENNTCEIAESFEINDAVYADEGGARAVFDVPPNFVIQSIMPPDDKPRRAPWDMPFPLEIRHEIIVKSDSMGSGSRVRRRWVQPEFVGTLDEPRSSGQWSKIARFTVKVDDVPVDRLPSYRTQLEKFLRATTWRIYAPCERTRPLEGSSFGALPASAEGISAYVPPADPADFTDASALPSDATPPGSAPLPAASRPWPRSDNSWRFAIPVAIVLAMGAARTCSTLSDTASDHYSSLVSAEQSGPPPRTTPNLVDVDREDAVLPPGPEIQGIVYENPKEVDQPPEATYRAPPNYPSGPRVLGFEGDAVIDFVVTDQGLPTRITVVRQTYLGFGKSASVAISKWRFRPAMKGGQPVNMALRQTISFRLDPNRPATTLFNNRLPSIFDKASPPPPGGTQKSDP